ncbi:E3 ubiquitin-protein ligase TRIM35-like [Oryzias latipes]
MSLLLPEDLSCTICRDVFRDPVVLTCSHSYCRACLQNWWSGKQVLECPVCKKRSSSSDMTSNLVLKKVCEAILERKAKGDADRKVVCRLHAEKLKLFCVDHQEPLCLVCLHSDAHAGHNVKPIEEVTRKHREQLRDLLKPLKENLKKLEDVKEDLRQTAEHIQFQAQQTEKFLREQFKELQAFIQKEEETRMKALREEEKKKSLAMKVKIESLSKDIAALSETVRETEAALGGEEAVFLQNFRSAVTRVQQSPPLEEPQPVSGALIDQAKHLGNLTFKVWKKMKTMASFTPVILDPNSANPELSLSQNLTAVTCGPRQNLPDNPERFSCFRIILGSKGFSSGICSWDVEIPENTDWFVGVASESVHRKGTHPSCLWRIGCTNGEYVARSLCDPSTVLPNIWKLNRIRVHLDWERGKLVFFDLDASTHIHTISHRFTETLFPYFNTVSARPLRIISESPAALQS